MERTTLLFLGLLLGTMQGQTAANSAPFIPLYAQSCDETLIFAGQTKPVREIFPLACATYTTGFPLVKSAPKPAAPISPDVPAIRKTFHHCKGSGGSGNSPHLFDISEIYQCDEGEIEVAGRTTMTIENGYLYELELGKPSCQTPRLVTPADYADYKWCPTPAPWDSNQKEMCGDKPTTCWDGRPGTWDAEWQGYSCVTPDHHRN